MTADVWHIPEIFKKHWRHISLLTLFLPGVAYLAGRRWRRFLLLWAFFAAAWFLYVLFVLIGVQFLSGKAILGLWIVKWALYIAGYIFQAVEAYRAL